MALEQGSLTTGTQRALGLTATGGTKKVNFNAELLSPLPGGGKDRTLRVYTFMDAGGIYGADGPSSWPICAVRTGLASAGFLR